MRAVGPPLQLWDVRNVEAHVRRALDVGLKIKGARLSPAQYDRCYQFLLQKCWELSGLEGDGKTLRYLWEIRGFVKPAGALEAYRPIKTLRFRSEKNAKRALESLRVQLPIAFASVDRVRPRGAYDPAKGISFSKYSWQLISGPRIDDWYRSDPEFGDTRYESNRHTEESLEAMGHRVSNDGDEIAGEMPIPLGRLEVIDELNKHAYQDAGEEVLTREAFGFGG